MKPEEFDGPRLIRREELRSGRELFKLCFGSELDAEMDETYVPATRGGWYVMLPNSGPLQGQVVSQIGIDHHAVEFEGSRLYIGSIGGVSTHPEFRRLGLADRLMEHCTHTLRQEEARLMLISGDRGLYTRRGNIPAMCFDSFTLKPNPALRDAVRTGVSVRPLTETDAPTCAQIYQSDTVHYLRQVEEYNDQFYPGSSWMVELDGVAAAYLLLHIPWEFMDNQGSDVRQMVDYGGSRDALAEGIKLMLSGGCVAFNQFGIRELRVETAWQDAQLAHQMAEIGVKEDTLTLQGHTMRLLNFPALRGDLEAYIAGRLPEAIGREVRFEQSGALLADSDEAAAGDGFCAIAWQQQRLELSTAEMTRLVMGSPDRRPGTSHPGMAGEGVPGEIVQALFPLPSFLPGLNYR